MISHAQIAAIASEVTGAELQYEEVDVERFVGVLQQAGSRSGSPAGWLSCIVHMDSDVTDAVATSVLRAPIAFQQFAREHADAFGLPRQVSAP